MPSFDSALRRASYTVLQNVLYGMIDSIREQGFSLNPYKPFFEPGLSEVPAALEQP